MSSLMFGYLISDYLNQIVRILVQSPNFWVRIQEQTKNYNSVDRLID